ncbi:unnamed protein product, partial [Ectocarpus sp. 12 AP-2014]
RAPRFVAREEEEAAYGRALVPYGRIGLCGFDWDPKKSETNPRVGEGEQSELFLFEQTLHTTRTTQSVFCSRLPGRNALVGGCEKRCLSSLKYREVCHASDENADDKGLRNECNG